MSQLSYKACKTSLFLLFRTQVQFVGCRQQQWGEVRLHSINVCSLSPSCLSNGFKRAWAMLCGLFKQLCPIIRVSHLMTMKSGSKGTEGFLHSAVSLAFSCLLSLLYTLSFWCLFVTLLLLNGKKKNKKKQTKKQTNTTTNKNPNHITITHWDRPPRAKKNFLCDPLTGPLHFSFSRTTRQLWN